eukprot:g3980.t1 g3980   contig15:68752-69985(-)
MKTSIASLVLFLSLASADEVAPERLRIKRGLNTRGTRRALKADDAELSISMSMAAVPVPDFPQWDEGDFGFANDAAALLDVEFDFSMSLSMPSGISALSAEQKSQFFSDALAGKGPTASAKCGGKASFQESLLCLKEQKAATAAASPAHLGSKSAKEEREIVTMIQMNAGISEDAPDTAILVVEKGTLEPVFIEILEAPDSDAYYEGGIGALPPGEWEIWVLTRLTDSRGPGFCSENDPHVCSGFVQVTVGGLEGVYETLAIEEVKTKFKFFSDFGKNPEVIRVDDVLAAIESFTVKTPFSKW